MDFGYFTLSDNHYDNNPRSSNQFVADITAEALYAEQLGMHSACCPVPTSCSPMSPLAASASAWRRR